MQKKKTITAWDRVVLARQLERPKALDYINAIFEEFVELHGDRNFGDDKAIIGGIATLKGMPITVIGEQKGKNVKENMKRNFGMPEPEGYRINGISAGPIKTLSAKGIKDFGLILDVVEEKAPLHKNVTTDQVGNATAFLFSDMSSAITGEIIHVDNGFSAVGV